MFVPLSGEFVFFQFIRNILPLTPYHKYQRENVAIELRTGCLELLRETDATSLNAVTIDYECIDDLIVGNVSLKCDAFEQMFANVTREYERFQKRRLCEQKFDSLAAERRLVDVAIRDAQSSLDRAQAAFDGTLQQRLERFRPFYEHMQVSMARLVREMCDSDEAQMFLFPELETSPPTAEVAPESERLERLVSAFDEGILLNIVPPCGRFRTNAQYTEAERVCVGLAIMFAVYEYAGQPFLFVHQLDGVLAECTAEMRTRLIDMLATQCHRHGRQIFLCTDRTDSFRHADVMASVLLQVSERFRFVLGCCKCMYIFVLVWCGIFV